MFDLMFSQISHTSSEFQRKPFADHESGSFCEYIRQMTLAFAFLTLQLYLQSPDIISLDQVQANPAQLVSIYNDFLVAKLDHTGYKQGKLLSFSSWGTDTKCHQWPLAVRQSSTPLFPLKRVTATLLWLLPVQLQMQRSLYQRSRTGVISLNMSARIPLWHSIMFKLQTLVLITLNLLKN